MSTISLSLACKPGKAIPGPYSSLMVLRRRASRSGAGRVGTGGPWEENEGQRRRRSDSTFNFEQKDSGARAAARCVPLSGADPSVSHVHAGIVSLTTWADFRPQQYVYRVVEKEVSSTKRKRISVKRRRRLPTPNAAAQETTPWRGGLRERRTAATRCGAGRSPGVASVRRLRRL